MLPRSIGARELLALALIVLPFATVDSAVAQRPTSAQTQAIRSSCRSDFISHCSGVQPGGREALECLIRNMAKLSPACSGAVSAVLPKPDQPKPVPTATPAPTPTPTETPAPTDAAQSPQEQLAAVSKVCTLSDFSGHCSFIQPNNPELVQCLKANAADLSPACQTVVSGLPAVAPSETPTPVAAPTPPEKPAPRVVARPKPKPTPQKPTSKQLSAIRASCRSDFISHCSGVQPGGREALECLERSKAEVSQACQTALAAITGGAAPTGSPEPTTEATPSEGFQIRRLPLRAELAILRVCIADRQTLCGGIPMGGGRILRCLAQNASQISPQCRAALAEARSN